MANFNPLKAFGSIFDKIGASAESNLQVAEFAKITAESVSIGGTLITKLDELINAVKVLSGAAEKPDFKALAASGSGFNMMDSLALAILAPTLKPLGKGMGFIVDVINNLEEGGEKKAKALESIFGILAKLGEVGKSIFVFAGWMILALPFLMITAIASPLIAIALGATLMAVRLATRNLDKKQMKKVQMLGDVGKSILMFTATLALAAVLMPFAMKGALGATVLILGIGLVFMLLEGMGIAKNMEKTAGGLALAGLAILTIGASLALFSLIQPLAMKGLLGAALIIFVIGFSFALLDALSGTIGDGGKALIYAGLAILTLGVSLVLFDRLDPGAVGMMKSLLFIGAISVVFIALGIFAKPIQSGAKALLWASLSIIVVGLAFQLMNTVLGDSLSDPANFAGLLLVAGLAAGFAVIGMGESLIKKGAIAMLLVGASLVTIAIGMAIMDAALKRDGWMLIGMTSALIIGLGLAFAGAGLAAAFILPGAAAMAVAGIALITVATGMLLMGKAYASKSVKDLVTPGSDGNTPIKTLLMAVADGFVMWPWTAVGVLAGAASMTVAGIALTLVAGSLMMFGKAAEKINLNTIGETIALMIGTLAVPFYKIGNGGKLAAIDPMTGKTTEIQFSKGSFWGGNPVANGVRSVLKMGTALTNIAGGVQSMANLKFATGFDKEGKATGYETIGGNAFKRVVTNTMMMVGALAIPFAKIGQGGKQIVKDADGNDIEVDFGAPSFSVGFLSIKSDVSKGVKSVLGFGEALSNLAGGVQDMANLKMPTGFDPKTGKPSGYSVFSGDSAQKVTDNTQMLVGALTGTFAEVGKNPDAESGFWGGSSTIQKGIDLVVGFGLPLVNLAKGVQDMANLRFANKWDKDGKAIGWHDMKDIGTVAENVKTNTKALINALTSVFAEIGSGEVQAGGWWTGYTNFDRGIEIVSLISEPYSKLGSSVTAISEAVNKYDVTKTVAKVKQFIGVFTDAGVGEDIMILNSKKLLVNAIGHTFEKLGTAIPAIVSATGSYDEKKGDAFTQMFIGPVDAKNPNTSYNAQKLLWHAVGHGISKSGENIPKIAEGINAIDLNKLVESRKMFEALGVLANGGEPSDILAQMGESLESALQNLADMLGEFQSSVAAGGAATASAAGEMTKSNESFMSKMTGSITGGSSTAQDSPDSGQVVAAIKQLQNTLTSSGVKINRSWFN